MNLPQGSSVQRPMNTPALASVLFAVSLLPAAGLALDVSIAAEIRLGRMAPPPPPEVVVVEEPVEKGPPPWAPAHGLRRNRSYYYYPGANVYYRPDERAWIYLEGRDWRVGASLPSGIRVDFDRSVSLTMETDRPYEFHDQVRTRYPSDYFTKKVRVKEKPGKPAKVKAAPARADAEHARPDDRGGGKPPGKGRNKDR